jgi:hypothetical protein
MAHKVNKMPSAKGGRVRDIDRSYERPTRRELIRHHNRLAHMVEIVTIRMVVMRAIKASAARIATAAWI